MKLLNTDKSFIISDEEITLRAEKVIDASSKNNKDGVIDIFEAISLPFSGKNYKRKVFEKIFELANIEANWDKKLGFIVYSENRTNMTVVSHMDLIPSFNKGFKNNKVYKIEDEKLIGALDNTFTNAVVINSILNNQAKDTTYLFTLDEETTQYAIRDYMKRFGSEQFVVNLDVTNDGKNSCMSIEYDEPSWHICKQIHEKMENPFFTTDRVGDDFDEVIKANGFGFSYCLPTEKKIHSYNNFTYLKNIEPYMKGLDFLVHELDLSVYNHNIDYLSIDESLEHSSYDEMKEKDVYVQPKYHHVSNDDLADEDYNHSFTYTPSNGSKSSKKLISFLKDYTKYYKSCSQLELEDFLDNTLRVDDFFTMDEFTMFISEEAFYDFLEKRIIRNTYQQYYDFELDFVKLSEFKIYEILKKHKNIDRFKFLDLILEEDINEFSYDEIIDLEKEKKFQNVSPAIMEMIEKGLIKKVKDKDLFEIK